jgi:Flp pilus assembly protein TadB
MIKKNIDLIVKEINKANQQRKKWLLASSIMVIAIAVYIIGWHWINELDNIWIDWIIVAIGLVISVNWWYWTMSLVRQYIEHQQSVMDLLSSIVTDIKIIKEDVKSLNSVDKTE